MAAKRHKAEEIVTKLRQVDVLNAQGKSIAEAIRSIAVTEATYYRWRSEYGGLKGDQVKRLKELEAENARLRRAVSDLTLDKVILAVGAKTACIMPGSPWENGYCESFNSKLRDALLNGEIFYTLMGEAGKQSIQ